MLQAIFGPTSHQLNISQYPTCSFKHPKPTTCQSPRHKFNTKTKSQTERGEWIYQTLASDPLSQQSSLLHDSLPHHDNSIEAPLHLP
jgi:hypothetical protein